MLSLAVRPCSPALAPFVAALHYHESELAPGIERIMPNGQAHLMINLGEDQFRSYHGDTCEKVCCRRGAVLAGPGGRSAAIDTLEQRWLAAVQFRPGGASAFFQLPLSETRDQMVDVGDLWGREGGLVRERLLEASTPARKLRLLETILLEHLTVRADPAVAYAMAALSHGMTVRDTAARAGFLPKTLVRRFEQQVGLTPKRFARVRRLQRILKAARKGSDWPEIAAQCGFADQAHLIHDFRELTGITPGAYRPQSARRGNHVPLAIPES